ncbi:O-antigen ligase family protein [Bacteroides sp. OttesenSCG-928-D19]|nr:O-antigen ligase family protein [Bacteroides sp. OttesenSCG-928-D19]
MNSFEASNSINSNSTYHQRIFYVIFVTHFVTLVISSYMEFKLGVITLAANVLTTALLIFLGNVPWKNSGNGMLTLFIVWGVFCFAEILNPNHVQEAWNIAITYYFVYPIICAIVVPVAIRKIAHIEWLLKIWSVFIIFGAIRGYIQMNYGFNTIELQFLFERGGASTHIIWSGIRYFSYFTDAANFGVHMAMGILVYGISFFYVKSNFLKIYFAFVVVAAIYGMGISGTRSSIAVPLGGLLFMVVLSRNWNGLFLSMFAFIGLFFFFRFTTIGNSNEYIRKMRSAFTPEEDASYNVRVVNREKIKEYLADKPFGYGLGLGGKAERFNPKEVLPIPPDSWLVNVWADTGVVGLVLYVLIHVILFAWCSWILMFQLTNKRLRGLLNAWLCVNAGFFISAYTNDVMQYPNSIIVFTGFALCFAGPYIEKEESQN